MKILLLSDIHGNYPALEAIGRRHRLTEFAHICNSGDSTVYCPFPNETLDWLRRHRVHSIRGNTDDKVIRLLKGKSFKKPAKADKRIMYTTTAEVLTALNQNYLLQLKKRYRLDLGQHRLGLFHGSPASHQEFLFAHTPEERFAELAADSSRSIIVTGHSHSPYHKLIGGVHFINPGAAGRMFDGNPEAAYAILTIRGSEVEVVHHRCPYEIEAVVRRIRRLGLPEIYSEMFRRGQKLN